MCRLPSLLARFAGDSLVLHSLVARFAGDSLAPEVDQGWSLGKICCTRVDRGWVACEDHAHLREMYGRKSGADPPI